MLPALSELAGIELIIAAGDMFLTKKEGDRFLRKVSCSFHICITAICSVISSIELAYSAMYDQLLTTTVSPSSRSFISTVDLICSSQFKS